MSIVKATILLWVIYFFSSHFSAKMISGREKEHFDGIENGTEKMFLMEHIMTWSFIFANLGIVASFVWFVFLR